LICALIGDGQRCTYLTCLLLERGRGDNDLNLARGDVVDETGDKPRTRQIFYGPQQRYVCRDRGLGIAHSLARQVGFGHLEVPGQHLGTVGEAKDAAVSVLEDDQVEVCAIARSHSGDLADLSEQGELLEQSRCDAAANVTHHNGFTSFQAKHVGGIDAHVGATDYECPDVAKCFGKSGADWFVCIVRGCELLVTRQ
jgi:hypothetical protein